MCNYLSINCQCKIVVHFMVYGLLDLLIQILHCYETITLLLESSKNSLSPITLCTLLLMHHIV